MAFFIATVVFGVVQLLDIWGAASYLNSAEGKDMRELLVQEGLIDLNQVRLPTEHETTPLEMTSMETWVGYVDRNMAWIIPSAVACFVFVGNLMLAAATPDEFGFLKTLVPVVSVSLLQFMFAFSATIAIVKALMTGTFSAHIAVAVWVSALLWTLLA